MATGKAHYLQALQGLNIDVPEFYVIPHSNTRQLKSSSIRKKILDEFNAWRKEHDVHAVAVRSSADIEDGNEQSFAGQFQSVMNITTDTAFLEAIKIVFESRPQKGYASKQAITMDIIVQRYIEPTSAGVIFTVNPSNGTAEMIINSVHGHGSAVVDGSEATTIRIERPSGSLRTERNNSSPLTTAQIKTLFGAAEHIERHFDSPQDIEWAFTGDMLHILQSRPITKLTHLKAWDNANIGESFPGIITPLTFSVARRGYELAYKSQAYEGGLSWYQLEANHRTLHDMVGIFGGRMYYNLASWYRFMSLFPGNAQNQKFLDEQLQTVGDVVYLPPSSYPTGQAIRYYARLVRRVLFFEREKRGYWQHLDREFDRYNRLPSGMSLHHLLDRYTFVEQMIVPYMGRSVDNDFLVMTYHGILKAYMQKWLGKNTVATTDFLGSLHDVISARQADLLNEIATAINHDATAMKLLKAKKYTTLDNHLIGTTVAPSLKEYRKKFLHRFASDQKLDVINPLLTLEGFYGLVAIYCQLDEKTLQSRRKNAFAHERNRHANVLRQLTFLQRIIYRLLLSRLKKHLRIREHNRLLRGKTYALLRDLFPLVGDALVRANVINDTSDIHYLDIEEILRLTNGTGYGDNYHRIIMERKKRYKNYKKLSAPSRFITTGPINDLPPILKKMEGSVETQHSLTGTLSSPGDITGIVIKLDEPIIPDKPFDILVVSHTDPGWTPLIALAKGVIVEHGGILSHAAIVTRELGIPSMIGVNDATRLLQTGMKVRINPNRSTVDIISESHDKA